MKNILFLLLSIALFSCSNSRNPEGQLEEVLTQKASTPTPSLQYLIDSLAIDPSDLFIRIDKSDYTLTVRTDEQLVKTFGVVFGGNPVDDKLREGDQCTPEGEFTIQDLYPHRKWSKFLWIDYPTADSWKKHNTAKAQGLIPEDAAIGGEIGIHGVPEGYDHAIEHRQNWTLGCISMTNEAVDELYPFARKGMRVIIVP